MHCKNALQGFCYAWLFSNTSSCQLEVPVLCAMPPRNCATDPTAVRRLPVLMLSSGSLMAPSHIRTIPYTNRGNGCDREDCHERMHGALAPCARTQYPEHNWTPSSSIPRNTTDTRIQQYFDISCIDNHNETVIGQYRKRLLLALLLVGLALGVVAHLVLLVTDGVTGGLGTGSEGSVRVLGDVLVGLLGSASSGL